MHIQYVVTRHVVTPLFRYVPDRGGSRGGSVGQLPVKTAVVPR